MTAADDYDSADDFARSIEFAYAAVRERIARGGPPWTPKPPQPASFPSDMPVTFYRRSAS
jgi:hypothetical protein